MPEIVILSMTMDAWTNSNRKILSGGTRKVRPGSAILYAAVLGALLSGLAVGQDKAATITGTLRDPNGNLIIGTEGAVHMKNTATQKDFNTPISSNGEFTLPGLPAGTYDLSVPMACCMYGSFEQKGIVVQAGQAVKLDLHLPWNINLGTIGDDPVLLVNDMRSKAKDTQGPTPRMADGKPDFSGMWAPVAEPGPRDYAGGPIPYKPWAAAIQKQIMERVKSDTNLLNPAAFCLPQSALQITLPFQFKLIQTPTLMIHLTEYQTPGYRQIFMDGRGHPKDWNPAWVGHSIGTWDGDALVVDSTGFNTITAGVGVHSEKLHVVERFRRPDKGHLDVELTIDDEDAYEHPWKRSVHATLVPQEEILEFVCAENNKDPLHFGGLGYSGGR